MSQEAAPERAMPKQSEQQSVPEQKGKGAPKGLLQQMEELMAALTADLSQLDADLQSTADRHETRPQAAGEPAANQPTHEGAVAEGPRETSPRSDSPASGPAHGRVRDERAF
ncbi:hypothetical protein J7E93_08630 [Streptomyces sp. ISL-36]|uniref:hypothetical protein n=1 Tax=Streptomyces sp. ISL-36 TaxID=2819182 RepID=UPI001BEA771D|nr:hypothetical protein [Streptomyces sp. ISL-36]MBT2440179.1 hypothetical protein [Streptomyces sp. ISL-36]